MDDTSETSNTEDIVTCVLCLDIYRDPRALPCLHSFCTECLCTLIAKLPITETMNGEMKSVLKCPLCQELHEVGDGGVFTFRPNFHIKTYIAKMEEDRKAAENLKMNRVDQGTDPMHFGGICPHHFGGVLHYYCTEPSCRKTICEQCWVESHKLHAVRLRSQMQEKLMEANIIQSSRKR